MSLKLFITALSILMLDTPSKKVFKNAPQGYIRCEWTGDLTKPIPVVYFFLKGISDTILNGTPQERIFRTGVEVSESKFLEISKIIANYRIGITDSSLKLSGEYQFTLVYNGEKTVAIKTDWSNVKVIFKSILVQFKNSNSESRIYDAFYETLGLLAVHDLGRRSLTTDMLPPPPAGSSPQKF